jgi:hypothetical protein
VTAVEACVCGHRHGLHTGAGATRTGRGTVLADGACIGPIGADGLGKGGCACDGFRAAEPRIGRPPRAGEAATVVVHLRLTPAEAAAVDAALPRGTTRGEFARKYMLLAARRAGKVRR